MYQQTSQKASDKSYIFSVTSALRVSTVHYLPYDVSVEDILLTSILTAKEALLEKLSYLARVCSLDS